MSDIIPEFANAEDEVEYLKRYLAEANEELEQKDNTIRIMVEKAAAKHRPAYDEQQRKILALTLRNEKLERVVARLSVLSIKHCDSDHHDFDELLNLTGVINQLNEVDNA